MTIRDAILDILACIGVPSLQWRRNIRKVWMRNLEGTRVVTITRTLSGYRPVTVEDDSPWYVPASVSIGSVSLAQWDVMEPYILDRIRDGIQAS